MIRFFSFSQRLFFSFNFLIEVSLHKTGRPNRFEVPETILRQAIDITHFEAYDQALSKKRNKAHMSIRESIYVTV